MTTHFGLNSAFGYGTGFLWHWFLVCGCALLCGQTMCLKASMYVWYHSCAPNMLRVENRPPNTWCRLPWSMYQYQHLWIYSHYAQKSKAAFTNSFSHRCVCVHARYQVFVWKEDEFWKSIEMLPCFLLIEGSWKIERWRLAALLMTQNCLNVNWETKIRTREEM